jgi:hypothetical protein
VFGLFGNKTKREIRRLNKDAPNIVEYSYQSLSTKTVRDAALMTAEHLEHVRQVYKDDPLGPKRAIAKYKTRLEEAARRHDDVALTAFTLVLIYVRAELQGEACAPARQAIDDFMDQWAHATED